MSVAAATAHAPHKPRLVFFYSSESGRCRRPDLAERFNVERVPTLYVVEGKQVRARLEEPRGCRDIQRFLAPWLA